MSSSPRCLHVIAYHYVRTVALTPFPRLHAFDADAFRTQVREIQERFEMATMESALAFSAGRYQPARDLCLLTFDDGVRDHFDEVFPCLRERRIQGLFFLITQCLDGHLDCAHQSHFLMAHLGFDEYRRLASELLAATGAAPDAIDTTRARATYRWDTGPAAEFKYMLNFVLPEDVRNTIVKTLFSHVLGDPSEFASRLYLSWDEAATMQAEGMAAGGHTHTHRPLSHLSPGEQRRDLTTCTAMLRTRLPNQELWPFSYPYGKLDSFDGETVALLQELGYACAFTTVPGRNTPGADPFTLRRIDPKEIVQAW
jgi:peptidoglycan/xylan/chitin deacetylase (PgdA/CDA1 family)